MNPYNPKKTELQEALEHRILHGLACEWKNALWLLDRNLRDTLRQPFFRLHDYKTRLGSWYCEKNEIGISRCLALNHSWDAVVEVLAHEIAHQVADVVFFAFGEPPHGQSFKKACLMLRANPKASGSFPALDDRVTGKPVHAEDKILVRVKKLMALAESRNRHEAEAAMAKAHKLIAKYNVELIEGHTPRDYQSIFIGQPALRHFREEYRLCHLLLDFYFVKGIWVPAFVLAKGKMGRVMEISGARENLQIASYVYDFIKNYIDGRWGIYNQNKKLNRYRKTDFAVGVIEGFRAKLDKQARVKNSTESSALQKIDDPFLKSYYHNRYPRIQNFSRKTPHTDVEVQNDGVRIGNKMVISKGIAEQKGGVKLIK